MAPKDGTFSIRFNVAADDATKKINQFNKALASVQAPAKRLGKSLTKFGELTGLSKLSQGFSSFLGIVKNVGLSLVGLLVPIGAITSVAGVYRMVTAWGEWGNKLSITSQLLGINASKLSQLQSVGTLGGASGDAMEGTLRRMQDIQRQIRLGLNPDAMRVYQKAGLDPRKSAEENMPKAFEAVKNFKGSAEAKRVLMGILGIDFN